jgi:hypothetical protein
MICHFPFHSLLHGDQQCTLLGDFTLPQKMLKKCTAFHTATDWINLPQQNALFWVHFTLPQKMHSFGCIKVLEHEGSTLKCTLLGSFYTATEVDEPASINALFWVHFTLPQKMHSFGCIKVLEHGESTLK